MTQLFINGKFTAQPITGTQRSAHHLMRALDAQLDNFNNIFITRPLLLLPPGAPKPELHHIDTAFVGRFRLPLHLWEQCLLPLAARGGVLLNLAGSAPLSTPCQVCMIHDAAVFDSPQAYTAAFGHWYRSLFRLLARRQTTMLTVSAFSQRRLASQLGIAANRFGIVPNGGEHFQAIEPDLTILARHGLEFERYLLAVGSENPNKNLAALRAAFGRLRPGQGVRLVLVGGSDPRVFASKNQRIFDVDAGIVRTGRLDDAALKALYQHAAGLVFPSLYEGFGLPPLEAMSCGCPVAASNAASIPEVCGDAALYFDPTSIDQIAAAMQKLIDDRALRERLRRAGASQLLHFSWPLAAAALLSQLQAHLPSRHREPRRHGAAARGVLQ